MYFRKGVLPMPQLPLISWLSQLKKEDVSTIGIKAANLGEMTSLSLPVPNGFAIQAQAYYDFLAQTKLADKINQLISETDTHQSASLQKTSTAIAKLIKQAKMPDSLASQIVGAYHQLSAKDVFVAVRPSLTDAADLTALSNSNSISHLNILGSKQVVQAVQSVWANLFQPRAIYYYRQSGLDALDVGSAIVVQRMIESEISGVVFSMDPLTNDSRFATIEAVWGLGEVITNAQVTPDVYQIDKSDWRITKKEIIRQTWQLLRTKQKQAASLDEANVKLPVSPAWQRKQKTSDRLIVEIAKMAAKLEQHFGQAQEIEWAYANHTLYVVQSRPMPMISHQNHDQPVKVSASNSQAMAPNSTPLLSGLAAAPGVVSGPARIIVTQDQVTRFKNECVVFMSKLDIDLQAAQDKILAIVTDSNDAPKNKLQALAERGVPVVVGVANGTKMVKGGEMVTVDAAHGYVYEGRVQIIADPVSIPSQARNTQSSSSPILSHLQSTTQPVQAPQPIQTATKVYVNLVEPESAIEYAQKNVDGVGLLRAEYMIQTLDEHPKHLMKQGKQDAFINHIYENVMQVAKAFSPRPVIYRLSDLSANQYMRLNGGQEFESHESNPALGFRGAYRHVNDDEPTRLEIQAIKKVRQYYKNVWIMVPFVRTPDELITVKNIISEEGLYRGGSFKLFMMAEVPSNVVLLDEFIGTGIDGISIGSNDLTQLMLGLDRHNPRVAAGFDERNEAVMWAMEKIVSSTIRHGLICSISGQAPSAYPELTRKLVEWGISSISVSPEAASNTRRLIADAEYELVRQGKSVKNRKV